MRLQEHVAVVTGAANNIGRAIARCFAAEGAKVLIADIQDEAGEAVAESIRGNGGEASFFHADVGTGRRQSRHGGNGGGTVRRSDDPCK